MIHALGFLMMRASEQLMKKGCFLFCCGAGAVKMLFVVRGIAACGD